MRIRRIVAAPAITLLCSLLLVAGCSNGEETVTEIGTGNGNSNGNANDNGSDDGNANGNGNDNANGNANVNDNGSGQDGMPPSSNSCFWEATLSGDFSGAFSGELATYGLDPSGESSGLLFIAFHRSDSGLSSGMLGANGRPLPGEVGLFEDVELTFFAGSPLDSFASGPDDEATQARLTLDSYEGGRMEGVIEGTLSGANISDPANSRIVQITIEFRAAEEDEFGLTTCPE